MSRLGTGSALGVAMLWLGCVIPPTSGQSELSSDRSAPPTRNTANSFQLSPGVIVDRDRPAVYLMNPRGGVDAVDLVSGKLLWSTDVAAKPLLLHREFLIARADAPKQSSDLKIVVINTRHIREGVRKFNVAIPPGLHVGIDDGLGKSFQTSARMHDGDIIVTWESRQQPATGVAPSPDVGNSSNVSCGTVRIDLETGGVDPVRTEDLPGTREPHLPDKVARLVDAGAIAGRPWRAGDVLAAISIAGRGGSRVILKRWNSKTGDSLSAVTLFDGGLTIRERSAAGRHILASRSAEPTDGAAEPYIWSIYSLETGERVGEVPNSSPGGRFGVVGSTMLQMLSPYRKLANGKWVEEPPRIRAIALKSGAKLWERPIRDTAYRGPYPPGQDAP